MIRLLLFSFLCLWFYTASGQVDPEDDRLVVLRHNRIGKTYVFDRSESKDHNRTELTYLGKVHTKDGRVFKVMISRWYWGLSPRATNRILIFNNRNQYVGEYHVTMTQDLPERLENNAMVFVNKHRDGCDPNLVVRISFYHGLPKQFFLECKDNTGDIYSFGSI